MAKDTGDAPAQPLTPEQEIFMNWVNTPEGQEWSAAQEPASAPAPAAAPDSAYENPLQTTGYWDDSSKVTMFDPNTGEYITKDVDPDNIFEFNPSGDQTTWGDVDGKRTLIYTGGGGYNEGAMVDKGDGHWDWVYGAEAETPTAPPIDHGIDRETGGQKPGDPDWTPPPVTDPWLPDDDGTGGDGGGGDPFVPPPTDDGGGGGDPPPVDWGGADNPLIGYEDSSNKDFYQRQFADMRNRGDNEQLRALAAAIRTREAKANATDEPMGDPWAWMGGSEQFKPTVGTGFDATWNMAPRYEGMSNAEIIANQDNDYLSKHPDFLAAAPDFTVENREEALSYLNSNPYTKDKGWTQAVNDLKQGLYKQTGATVGGLPVPEGYASPVNQANLTGGA